MEIIGQILLIALFCILSEGMSVQNCDASLSQTNRFVVGIEGVKCEVLIVFCLLWLFQIRIMKQKLAMFEDESGRPPPNETSL